MALDQTASNSMELPHFDEAERAVLGSMLVPESRATISTVVDVLGQDEKYFYRKRHQVIYRTIVGMFEENQEVDATTLAKELDNRNQLDDAGGASYLSELVKSVPSTTNAEHYAGIVKEEYVERSLIKVCDEITTMTQEEDYPPDELIDRAEEKIFSVKKNQVDDGLKSADSLVESTFDMMEEADQRDDDISGIRTGFHQLDEKLSGFQSGQLIILAGRPGMGKTAFALSIAKNVVLENHDPVAMFSLEMEAEKLLMRILASTAKVSFQKIRDGEQADRDWHRITNAMGRLESSSLYISDESSVNVLDIRAQARRLKADKGLSLLIVDYLQLLESKEWTESREQEVAQISRRLKTLAMELEVPVLMHMEDDISTVERRGGDKRPKLSDLRGSGAIEQDADVVSFVYRPYFYTEKEEDRGIADIIVEKQRNGPTGPVRLGWQDDYMTFTNYEPDADEF
ncbi:MAG: replicative DNA helicase [bacterium]